MAMTLPDDAAEAEVDNGSYNAESKQWSFSRKYDDRRIFQVISSTFKTLLAASATRPFSSDLEHSALPKTPNATLARFPTLAAASKLLPRCASLSESITRHSAVHEPLAHALIVYGNALPWYHSKEQLDGAIRVVAFPSGPLGDVVRIAATYDEAIEEGTLRAVVPAIGLERCTYWCGNRSPIQQLCISRASSQPGSHLAVRSVRGTTILRLGYPIGSSCINVERKHVGAVTTRVNARHVTSIGVAVTRSANHAFVSFHPRDEHQIVIMTTEGHWTVLCIKECCKEDIRRCNAVVVTVGGRGSHYVDQAPSTDGWGYASWTEDSDYLLTASRLLISFSSIAEPAKQVIRRIEELGTSSAWILDIQPHPSEANIVIVLTTHRILCLRLRADNATPTKSISDFRVDIVRSVLHHQNAADSSLRLRLGREFPDMHAPPEDGAPKTDFGLLICVHARLSGLLAALFLNISHSGSLLQWACDSSGLVLHGSQSPKLPVDPWIRFEKRPCTAIDVCLTPLSVHEARSPDSEGRRDPQNNGSRIRMFHVLILHKDLSLTRVLACASKEVHRLSNLVETDSASVAQDHARERGEHEGFITPDKHLPKTEFMLRRPWNLSLNDVDARPLDFEELTLNDSSLTWLTSILEASSGSWSGRSEAPVAWLRLLNDARLLKHLTHGMCTLFERLCEAREDEQNPMNQVLELLLDNTRRSGQSPCTEASALVNHNQPSELLQVWEVPPANAHSIGKGYSDILSSLRYYMFDHWTMPQSSQYTQAPEADDFDSVSLQLLTAGRASFPSSQGTNPQSAERGTSTVAATDLGLAQPSLERVKKPGIYASGLHATSSSQVELASSQRSEMEEIENVAELPLHILGQCASYEKQGPDHREIAQHILGDWELGLDPRMFVWKGTSQQRTQPQPQSHLRKAQEKPASSRMEEAIKLQLRGIQALHSSQGHRTQHSTQTAAPTVAPSSSQPTATGMPGAMKSYWGMHSHTSQHSQSVGQRSGKLPRKQGRAGF